MPDIETIERVKEIDVDKYKYGFETIIESDTAPKGLSEEVIRFISAKKDEPEWMLEQRLDAYRRWLKMEEPTWAKVHYPKIDFNDIYYYSAPKGQTGPKSLDEVDPELLATYAKLGIPLKEQEILAGVRKQGEPSHLDEEGGQSYTSGNVAVDAVFELGLGGDDLQERAGQGRRHLLLDLGSHPRTPRTGEEVPVLGGAAGRQLLRRAQLRRVY